ncbi:MAG: DUF4912 domain-containing protein [Acidobacteria bacterium]|nr:DUF4912 domain-containing protein [Acidobacteriota bacterium]
MPFFFDLSSLVPVVERNPFEPLEVPDVAVAQPIGEDLESVPDEDLKTSFPADSDSTPRTEETTDEAAPDFGLPIPERYDFDMMRAMCQDPFRLFVYWQLKANPFDHLRKIFPSGEINDFHSVLKLVDETTNISVFFNAAFTNEYWFSVFPDRLYRVELGVRSMRYGYIKLLTSQPVLTPRGGPSDQAAPEEHYQIEPDEFLDVLRDSHLVPQRAFTIEEMLPGAGDVPAGIRNAVWDSFPASFRRLIHAIADIQAGRSYERWWELLSLQEQSKVVREFLDIISQMGDGELGYMLLLRYLPELLRRTILEEQQTGTHKQELQIDKPIQLFLAEKLSQTASEVHTITIS